MIQTLFNLCVEWLHRLAALCGTDYVTVNVVLFCFIGPAVFLLVLMFAIAQYLRAESYKLRLRISLQTVLRREID